VDRFQNSHDLSGENCYYINKPPKSYAEVVKGTKRDKEEGQEATNSDEKVVELFPSEGLSTKLESALVGQLKSFDSLRMVGDLNNLEGWSEIRVSYLGGLAIQLDFPSKEAALEFLGKAEDIWKDWFRS